ncbi:hypothetical protein GS429_18630 [Natronorubrum sp. JWXQ-INN-674]|uniref:Halobacterial output domain-containing protein n=1 Tax=Natronorubrum halalkaliphilum TaxID=2691917 RepID=A0A6B0VTC1_9EURY|nr:HalOD1 output domain-containing protein [Natronorubrum halalkaliphilum]MXV64042.1 hypothetical protein [Natronorubrum halalkaliphilum]
MTNNNSTANVLGEGVTTCHQPVSEKVVRAVAEREGADPTALHPPLYDAINPEALDSLFGDRATDGRVEFHWLDYRIVVFSSGSIRVLEDGPR